MTTRQISAMPSETLGQMQASASLDERRSSTSLSLLYPGWKPTIALYQPSVLLISSLYTIYNVSTEDLLRGRTVSSIDHTEYEWLGQVVEEIENPIFRLNSRPESKQVAKAVVEVLRLETDRARSSVGAFFDPSRYRGLVEEIFKK